MSYQNNTTRATEQGRVVLNGQRDSIEIKSRMNLSSNVERSETSSLLYKGGAINSDELFTIMPGEPCLQNTDSNISVKRSFNDMDAKGFSSLNGMYLGQYPGSDISGPNKSEKIRLKKRKKLSFLGIAGTRAQYSSSDPTLNETAIPFQVGGIKTIINTGNDDIHVGDKVVWDLPSWNDHLNRSKNFKLKGISHDKILVKTSKYSEKVLSNQDKMKSLIDELSITTLDDCKYVTNMEDLTDSTRALYKLVILISKLSTQTQSLEDGTMDRDFTEENGYYRGKLALFYLLNPSQLEDSSSTIQAALTNTLPDLFFSLQEDIDEQKNRVIGKALTNGSRGKQFDLLIGKYV